MVFRFQQKDSAKSLPERYCKLVDARICAGKSNSSASGISYVLTEAYQLLTDLILEMNEHEEEVKREEKNQTNAEKALFEAGELIREKETKKKVRSVRERTGIVRRSRKSQEALSGRHSGGPG